MQGGLLKIYEIQDKCSEKVIGVSMDTKILLENGTNELEILEFTLAGNSYGINVAKIKEIITYHRFLIHIPVSKVFLCREIQ